MKTACPQCHTDGHHKMSCTDESNPARKDRVTVSTSLKEPIVKRYYYERDDGVIVDYSEEIDVEMPFGRLTRRVWITHIDPAEVVAELRRHNAEYFEGSRFWPAADLVAEKLGVES